MLLLKEDGPATYKGPYTNQDNPGHLVMRSIGPSATAPVVIEQDGSLTQPNVAHWVAIREEFWGMAVSRAFLLMT